MALDYGDVDNTLYTAAAKGADRIVKIPLEKTCRRLPGPRPLCSPGGQAPQADLAWSAQAHDELDGGLPPFWPRPWAGPTWA